MRLFLFDSGRLGVCGLCLFPLFRCSVVPSDSTSRSRSLRCVIRSALILTLILHSAIIDIGTPLPLPSLCSTLYYIDCTVIVIPDQLHVHVFRISCFTGLEVFDLFFWDYGRWRWWGPRAWAWVFDRWAVYQLSIINYQLSVIHVPVRVYVHIVAH